ncbi:MAG: LicD family protein [Anaerovoracaceae bacterium]
MHEVLDLQKKLMELMIEVDSICRENNITYYLNGGNVIGAVRHRGFIPWDDDIDLVITRDNWEKFHRVFQKKKPLNRALVCKENNSEHTYFFARYVDTKTSYSFRWKAFNTKQEGIAVDFAIFEKISDDILLQQKYKKWLIVLGEFVARRTMVNRYGNIRLYQFFKCLEKIFGKKAVMDFLEKKVKKYVADDSNTYIQLSPHQGFNWTCSAEYFKDPEEVEVEGHLLYAPTNSRGFIRTVYGDDWMFLPEVNQRKVHMGKETDLYSLNVSDAEAEKDALNWVNPEKYDNCYVKQKPLIVKRSIYENIVNKIDTKIRCHVYSLELSYKLKNLKEDVQKLLENNMYLRINEIFSDYVRQQLLEYKKIELTTNIPDIGYMRIHAIDIPYDKLKVACMSLILSGKYFIAQKILDIHFGINEKRPSEFIEVQKIIDVNREWSIARYDDNDWEKIEKISNEWLIKYPYHKDFLYSSLYIEMNRAEQDDDIKEVLDKAKDALLVHPDSFEILRIIADAKLKLGLDSEAIGLYKNILKESNNGMLNLEIKDTLQETKGIQYEDLAEETIKENSINTRNDQIHGKLLQLFKEIDRVCRQANIPYFLEPVLAWEAINKGTLVNSRFSNRIIMRPVDRERIINILMNENIENRALECFETNGKYVEFSVRYCDTSTILFNCKELGLYDRHNISVEIVFIRSRNKNKVKRKLSALMLTAIKNASSPGIFLNQGIKNTISTVSGKVLLGIFGAKRVKRKLWQYCYFPDRSVKAIKGAVRTYNSKWLKLPKLDFTKKEIAYIDNNPFPVPENYIEYIKCWKKVSSNFTYVSLNDDKIIGIPEASGEGDLYKISRKEIIKRKRASYKIKSLNSKIKKYSPYILRSWEYVKRSLVRIELMRFYLPKKKEIICLHNERNYDELELILKKYIDSISFFSKKNLAIYFDSDIFRITWDVMEYKGIGHFVENILPQIDSQYINYKKKEVSSLHSVHTQSELERILKYLKKEQKNCLYLYADLSVYGLNNPNITLWCNSDKYGIHMVIMQYHGNFQIYANRSFDNIDDVVELINRQRPMRISARHEIIGELENRLPQYISEYGVIMENLKDDMEKITDIILSCDIQIGVASIEDCSEIANLLFKDPELSAAYTLESLTEELEERIRTGMGRSFIVRDEGKIIAHVATYAETESFAITSGFIVDPQHRDSDYAYYLDAYIDYVLKKEGKRHIGMVLDKRLQKAFKRKGHKTIAEYGNLSLINN